MLLRSALLFVLALAACSPQGEKPAPGPNEVTFTATEFAFAGPDTIPAGLTTFRLMNHGQQEHHLILFKLEENHSLGDLVAAFSGPTPSVPEWVSVFGGVGGLEPSGSGSSASDLPAGRYALLCFFPDMTDSGKMHLSKGMARDLIVAGEPAEVQPLAADIEIRMSDFTYAVTPDFSAGTHTIRLVNDGPQVHEVQLVKLDPGKTIQDYMAASAPGAQGPPPGRLMGGAGALSPGKENYWTVSFEPGTYAILCFVPDNADGTPHAMKGMIKEFTIGS